MTKRSPIKLWQRLEDVPDKYVSCIEDHDDISLMAYFSYEYDPDDKNYLGNLGYLDYKDYDYRSIGTIRVYHH